MRTRILFLLICTNCLIAAPAVWGQAANTPAKPGILGYLDPHTGAFRPVPASANDDTDLPAATTFTGTITVTITITVKSTSVSNFTCTADTSVFDGTTSPTTYDETTTVTATGTGSTRTCKLTIPYAWSLTTQSTDNMITSYSVFATTGTTGLPQRTATRSPLDTRKVPASGATTALTAAVTI